MKRLVKIVVNCVPMKCDGFNCVKVDQWNGMRKVLNCVIVGVLASKEEVQILINFTIMH